MKRKYEVLSRKISKYYNKFSPFRIENKRFGRNRPEMFEKNMKDWDRYVYNKWTKPISKSLLPRGPEKIRR